MMLVGCFISCSPVLFIPSTKLWMFHGIFWWGYNGYYLKIPVPIEPSVPSESCLRGEFAILGTRGLFVTFLQLYLASVGSCACRDGISHCLLVTTGGKAAGLIRQFAQCCWFSGTPRDRALAWSSTVALHARALHACMLSSISIG